MGSKTLAGQLTCGSAECSDDDGSSTSVAAIVCSNHTGPWWETPIGLALRGGWAAISPDPLICHHLCVSGTWKCVSRSR